MFIVIKDWTLLVVRSLWRIQWIDKEKSLCGVEKK
jgi:hypothetical protein